MPEGLMEKFPAVRRLLVPREKRLREDLLEAMSAKASQETGTRSRHARAFAAKSHYRVMQLKQALRMVSP